MNIKLHITILTLFLGLGAHAQSSLTLQDYLAQVRERNLDLKIESKKFDALDAKAVGVALPAPMIGFNQMEMENGSTANGFKVSQSIPFPTKLSSDYFARKLEAKSQKEISLAAENEIMAKAKLAYFLLWSAQERLNTLLEKKSIIAHHIKLSVSAVRSDSFLKLHVLKAESDLDLLDNEIESLRVVVLEKQLLLAQLVYADLNSFKPTLAEPPLSIIPDEKTLKSPHQVEALRLSHEMFKSKEFEAKSSWLPDFELSYKEMDETSMAPKYKEYMLAVSIPFVFFWEPASKSSAAKSESLTAELQYKKERQKVDAEIITLISRAQALKKQINTLKDKLLPRTEKRSKITKNIAPRDMETLQDHRESMEAFPDLKLIMLDLKEKYEEIISQLEAYALKKDSFKSIEHHINCEYNKNITQFIDSFPN